jgi:hypothetical protein
MTAYRKRRGEEGRAQQAASLRRNEKQIPCLPAAAGKRQANDMVKRMLGWRKGTAKLTGLKAAATEVKETAGPSHGQETADSG